MNTSTLGDMRRVKVLCMGLAMRSARAIGARGAMAWLFGGAPNKAAPVTLECDCSCTAVIQPSRFPSPSARCSYQTPASRAASQTQTQSQSQSQSRQDSCERTRPAAVNSRLLWSFGADDGERRRLISVCFSEPASSQAAHPSFAPRRPRSLPRPPSTIATAPTARFGDRSFHLAH
jgi:hypothetical protein